MGKLTLLHHLRNSSVAAKQFVQGLAANILSAAAADVAALDSKKQDKISGEPGMTLWFDDTGKLVADYDNSIWFDDQEEAYYADGHPVYHVRGIGFAGDGYQDGKDDPDQIFLVRRSGRLRVEGGTIEVEDPEEAVDVANKVYVDSAFSTLEAVINEKLGDIESLLAAI